MNFSEIFSFFNEKNFEINEKPWINVLWNDIENKMLMNNSTLTYLLMLYLYDDSILTVSETKKLKEGYAFKIGIENQNHIQNVLDGIQ